MHAELWGIVRGLQISVANNISSLVVESDSIVAVNFIKKRHNSSHLCTPLLDDIVVLASRVPHISWSHCLREANFAADNLAKKGHDLPFGLHLFEDALPDTAMMIMRDLSGSLILRGSN
ncbi:uncharacterized protein LOC107480384 [Arachis duranensis]|uniref:RNase H type-1 domain-containing protein n=2 Tax=Arachis TaxID=3817 RepID=A0A445DS42_ARAHY|nr:uncharacterized protein LOC107480384 [Arachis duranensis]XP_025680325.1 uncharacterized protein LOC112781244 [Arachis hypogaea]RYR66002.1 hypothetical protein Ahy_A03g011928 [Arachis hypogaea]